MIIMTIIILVMTTSIDEKKYTDQIENYKTLPEVKEIDGRKYFKIPQPEKTMYKEIYGAGYQNNAAMSVNAGRA